MFFGFWQSRHVGGILRGTALTTQSFSPNGGCPTRFVPDLMFSSGLIARGLVAVEQPQLCCCTSPTGLVWLPHRPCAASTQDTLCRAQGTGGLRKSRKSLGPRGSTHTHTQDRYPTLWGDVAAQQDSAKLKALWASQPCHPAPQTRGRCPQSQ